MKKIVVILVSLSLMFIACSNNTSKGKVLVKIGGDKITEGDLDFLTEINPRLKSQLSNPFAKKQLLDKLVEQEILYREALKRGLHRDKATKAKIDLYRRVIIAQEAINDEVKKAADEYYKNNLDEFKKLQMSQIMIRYATPEDLKRLGKAKKKPAEDSKWITRTEEQALKLANEIKDKLDKGANFGDLAKEYSDDMLSKSRGGDLGMLSKNEPRLASRGYAPLLDKAFTMKVGEVAGPIKTDKGYHIITVTKEAKEESLDEVRDSIEAKIGSKTRNDLIAKLKEEEKVTYVEDEEKKKAMEKAKQEKMEKEKTAPKEDTVKTENQNTTLEQPNNVKTEQKVDGK